MQIIPIQPVPNQTLAVNLNGQACQINIYQTIYGLFLDLYVNNGATLVVSGVLCEDLNRIVRSAYLGFTGDLAFIDTQGLNDPVYAQLGSRYVLAYLEASDLVDLGFAA